MLGRAAAGRLGTRALWGGLVALALFGLMLPSAIPSGIWSLEMAQLVSPAFGGPIGPGVAANCNATLNSTEWAGYVVQTCTNPPIGAIVTNVSASWVVPTATCYGLNNIADIWVGLDGWAQASNSIEEIGTEIDCSVSGPATYSAYLDMYPYAVFPISIVINPGDTIYATVTSGGGHFFLTIRDATDGQYFSSIQNNGQAHQSSAEWVVGPSPFHPNVALTDFGTVTFWNANVIFYGTSASINGGYWEHNQLILRNAQGAVIGGTTGLNAGGAGFNVVFKPGSNNCLPISSWSMNWAGYVDQPCVGGSTGAVSKVSANWVMPTGVVCPPTTFHEVATYWIGLGGYSDPTLEQIGTEENCIMGSWLFGAWWEIYPNARVMDIRNVSARPGDSVSASLSYTGASTFVFSITDNTAGTSATFTRVFPGVAAPQSAEWIVESGVVAGVAVTNLLNFHAMNFTSCLLTIGSVTGPITGPWQTISLTMGNIPRKVPMATVGPLQSGNSFMVSWARSFAEPRARVRRKAPVLR